MVPMLWDNSDEGTQPQDNVIPNFGLNLDQVQ